MKVHIINHRCGDDENDYITSYPASLSDMSIKEKGDIVNDHFDDTIAIELHK